MMNINRIEAFNFRNFSNIKFEFDRLNIIEGKNGSGKSNFIELIYYFFTNTSFKPVTDNQLLKEDQSFFSIEGSFDLDKNLINNQIKDENIFSKTTFDKKIMYVLNRGKKIKFDDDIIKNIYFYIPVLENKIFYNMIYTLDYRRKYFDNILSFVNSDYRLNLLNQNKILKLKKDFYTKYIDIKKIKSNILMLNEKLAQTIYYITSERQSFFYRFFKSLTENLNSILYSIDNTGLNMDLNGIKVVYKSIFKDLEYDQIKFILDEAMEKEIKTERLYGNHVDGIYFYFNNKNIHNILSFGQIKTFFSFMIFKLLEFFEEKMEYKPVILIDDFFIDMDSDIKSTILKIMEHLIEKGYQIFLTFLEKDYIFTELKNIEKKQINI